MRFFSRREKKDAQNPMDTEMSHSKLGIFSPTTEEIHSDPIHETKRLAELERIFIRSKRLESLDDVPFIVSQVRDGNIVLLDISQLNNGREQTHLELKRIVERIRGETRSYRADIALVNDSCIIVAPSFVSF